MKQNRLYSVKENAPVSANPDDIETPNFNFNIAEATINTVNNYSYDEIGNLTKDGYEDITGITWMVNGKIKSVTRTPNSTKKNLRFEYDASGNRIAKHVYNSNNVFESSTYYVRDAQGNVMAIYDNRAICVANCQTQNPLYGLSYKLIERNLYGSARIGIDEHQVELIGGNYNSQLYERNIGNKQFELSNHLGNINAVVSDRKLPATINNVNTDHFLPHIVMAIDYNAFGDPKNLRQFGLSNARVGFGGKEVDNEIKGPGNSLDFEARIYDSRLGRWLSLDILQKKYPSISPYAYSNNSPITFTDHDGMDPRVAIIMETHPEKNEFNDHIKGLQAAGYTIIKVKTGEEFLNALKANSSKDSPIEDLVVVSHASNDGFFGHNGKDNGFYHPAGLENTAEATKSMEFVSDPRNQSNIEKTIEYIESDAFKKDVVDPYKKEMVKKGARTTDDLKKMIDNGEIHLSDKSKEIVLGGCNTVSNFGSKTIATEVANSTGKVVIGSNVGTAPVQGTTKRLGRWNKISPFRTVIPIKQGNKLDLTTRKVTP